MTKPKIRQPSRPKIEEDFWEVEQTDQGFKRDDRLKPRFDLIPAGVMLELASLYAHNLNNYPERNWEQGMAWGRIFRAMMTHAWRWWGGEDIDPDSGYSHLTHVIWNAIALLTYTKRNQGGDDRPYIPQN